MRDIVSSAIVMPLATVMIATTLMGMVAVYRDHSADSRTYSRVAAARQRPDRVYGSFRFRSEDARVVDAELIHLTAELTEDLARLFGAGGTP